MQSFLGKRVARELRVLRHIPELKVYELRVEWESDASSSTFFLSEVFLYPYSLRPPAHLPRPDKTSVPSLIEPTFDSNGTGHPHNETNSNDHHP
jgi:hypothetical protein